MTQERQAVPAERLARLNEQVERWRRERTKRSPMPAHLWDQAVSLARQMGINPVAAAVGLSYESLSQRVARGDMAATTASQGGFVELSGPQRVTRSGAPATRAPQGGFVDLAGTQRAAPGGVLAARTAPGAFVELTATRLPEPPAEAGLVVEVSDPQGVRLTVRLAAGSALDVVRLVEAFRQRAA